MCFMNTWPLISGCGLKDFVYVHELGPLKFKILPPPTMWLCGCSCAAQILVKTTPPRGHRLTHLWPHGLHKIMYLYSVCLVSTTYYDTERKRNINIIGVTCNIMYYSWYNEPHLADTPEKQTCTIMQTLCLVQNSISMDLHTIRTPEMQPPHYSVKHTWLGPDCITAHTNPHSGHFGETFVDSLVNKWQEQTAN